VKDYKRELSILTHVWLISLPITAGLSLAPTLSSWWQAIAFMVTASITVDFLIGVRLAGVRRIVIDDGKLTFHTTEDDDDG
jgi:hypothetical protein